MNVPRGHPLSLFSISSFDIKPIILSSDQNFLTPYSANFPFFGTQDKSFKQQCSHSPKVYNLTDFSSSGLFGSGWTEAIMSVTKKLLFTISLDGMLPLRKKNKFLIIIPPSTGHHNLAITYDYAMHYYLNIFDFR